MVYITNYLWLNLKNTYPFLSSKLVSRQQAVYCSFWTLSDSLVQLCWGNGGQQQLPGIYQLPNTGAHFVLCLNNNNIVVMTIGQCWQCTHCHASFMTRFFL